MDPCMSAALGVQFVLLERWGRKPARDGLGRSTGVSTQEFKALLESNLEPGSNPSSQALRLCLLAFGLGIQHSQRIGASHVDL